jgi:hypothetical protein
MPRPCSVCQHPQLVAIDARLDAGDTDQRVAEYAALSRDAIRRHRLGGHVAEPPSISANIVDTWLRESAKGKPTTYTAMQALRSEEALRRTGERASSPVAQEIIRSFRANENRYKTQEAQRAETILSGHHAETIEERIARMFGVPKKDALLGLTQALGGVYDGELPRDPEYDARTRELQVYAKEQRAIADEIVARVFPNLRSPLAQS